MDLQMYVSLYEIEEGMVYRRPEGSVLLPAVLQKEREDTSQETVGRRHQLRADITCNHLHIHRRVSKTLQVVSEHPHNNLTPSVNNSE